MYTLRSQKTGSCAFPPCFHPFVIAIIYDSSIELARDNLQKIKIKIVINYKRYI
jgi:hypothetical protein